MSSAAPATVTVVIGSTGAPGALELCLDRLAAQREGVEVLVCDAQPVAGAVARRFPWARFVHVPGALVPALWSEGIRQSDGDIVALTISPMRPAPDWIEQIRSSHREHDAVGGAIEPAPGLRQCDFAEYLCRYARDMLPFTPHASLDLPGDNASYSRHALELSRDVYHAGFWEPDVHREMARHGLSLWQSDTLIVHQGRSAGARAFMRQRLAHGRAYGHQRGVRFSRARNAVGVIAAPVVPLLMLARTWSELSRRGRLRARAVTVVPFMLLYNGAWALGEARGHLETLLGIEFAQAGAHA